LTSRPQTGRAFGDAVRAAYNYAEHLPERRARIQRWANYLDGLKTGAEVVPLRGKRA